MPDVEISPCATGTSAPGSTSINFHARVRDYEPEAKVYEIVRIVTVLNALITIRRGSHDEEAFITSARILERGGVIGM